MASLVRRVTWLTAVVLMLACITIFALGQSHGTPEDEAAVKATIEGYRSDFKNGSGSKQFTGLQVLLLGHIFVSRWNQILSNRRILPNRLLLPTRPSLLNCDSCRAISHLRHGSQPRSQARFW